MSHFVFFDMNQPRILLINPNTAGDITARIHALALEECGDRATVASVTARFGASYISDRASAAIAAHAVLDAFASYCEASPPPDSVVIACFGDPGLEALAERLTIPVVGFAEAGIRAAAEARGSFIIATIGESWRDMLTELVGRLGLSTRLAGFAVLGDNEREPAAAARLIDATAAQAGAERAVLGGTGLIPLIAAIAEHLKLPMIDPHRVAIREAQKLAAQLNTAEQPAPSGHGTFTGLSDALTRLLEEPALDKSAAE
jgi:allantoin racemase